MSAHTYPIGCMPAVPPKVLIENHILFKLFSKHKSIIIFITIRKFFKFYWISLKMFAKAPIIGIYFNKSGLLLAVFS